MRNRKTEQKIQPSHLLEHIDAAHAHARDLASSVKPGVARRDMTAEQIRNQHADIAGIRGLVEENLNHLADIRRHLDEFHKKLTQLESMYR